MKLSRVSVGLAIRSAREAAKLTLNDLAPAVGMTVSSLSRSETGQRDLEFAEVVALAAAFKVDLEHLRTLAETFERGGAADKQRDRERLLADLNDLQRQAIEAAIEARAS